jgi:hypothetical protein
MKNLQEFGDSAQAPSEYGRSDDRHKAGVLPHFGFCVFALHHDRVSVVVDSSHSVRPLAGEVVFEDTTARGYSPRNDAREARLECVLTHTQPRVQLGQVAVVDRGVCSSDDVKRVQSVVPHHRLKDDSPRCDWRKNSQTAVKEPPNKRRRTLKTVARLSKLNGRLRVGSSAHSWGHGGGRPF